MHAHAEISCLWFHKEEQFGKIHAVFRSGT